MRNITNKTLAVNSRTPKNRVCKKVCEAKTFNVMYKIKNLYDRYFPNYHRIAFTQVLISLVKIFSLHSQNKCHVCYT